MLEVAGSLWSVPAADRISAARDLADAGLRRLHWDMTDGRFAAAGGFTGSEAAHLHDATGMAAEAHIMAIDSAAEVDAWTTFCDLVIVHAESGDWQAAVDRIRRRGAVAGLALSPGTPVETAPAGMPVLCMSITPGQAGSAFDRGVLSRVARLRATDPDRRIGLDGGMKRDFVPDVSAAGADWVVVGTDLFFHDGATRWRDMLGGDPARDAEAVIGT